MTGARARLGASLITLCTQAGVQAGIDRELPRPGRPVSWKWWVSTGRRSAHGWSPSLEAARLDLQQQIRPLLEDR
jgi:hypothetical protein